MEKERTYHLESFVPPALLLAALLLYWPSLRVFFSIDDLRFLMRAAGLEESSPGIKRVLSVHLYFHGAWALFGTRAQLYHLVTIFLHAANAWLVFLTAKRLKLGGSASITAAVLFMVSTVAFLPMHWISGIQEASMTFFAILAAYFYLGSGRISVILALAAATLSLLCKEASLFMLPGLALVIPAPKRRRLVLGLGGLLMGIGFLAASGSFGPRPAGDPYEAVFGINILWNLLTYTAWLIRIHDYFPDSIPQYQTGLAVWGSILPAALGIIAWRFPRARRPVGTASLMFMLLLLPVLGLVRHSYFYYLYLPMIPVWLLAGACLEDLSRRRLTISVLVLAVAWSIVAGTLHRGSEITKGVPEDPVLRYAAVAGRAVSSLAASGHLPEGRILFVRSFESDTVDLANGLEGRTGTAHRKVHLFRMVMLDGEALRLFYPRIDSVRFEGPEGAVPGWDAMHFYGTYGLAETIYLGYGEEGRMKLISDCMKAEMYDRADSETDIMLSHTNDRPSLLLIKGSIAGIRGDTSTYDDIIGRLEILERSAIHAEEAGRALSVLRQDR